MLVDSCLKVQRPWSVAHDDDAPAALVVTSTHLDVTTGGVPVVATVVVPVVVPVVVAPTVLPVTTAVVVVVVPVVVVIVAPVVVTTLGLASAPV